MQWDSSGRCRSVSNLRPRPRPAPFWHQLSRRDFTVHIPTPTHYNQLTPSTLGLPLWKMSSQLSPHCPRNSMANSSIHRKPYKVIVGELNLANQTLQALSSSSASSRIPPNTLNANCGRPPGAADAPGRPCSAPS
jgi:hypothetical protein